MPKTLLLADDSVTIQKVVAISFANENIRLVSVDNGDDALTEARAQRPDAILADVVMPGLTGYELCEALKQEPELAQIPVLLLTGTFEAFDEERAQRCGAAGQVAKPFEAQALVARVRELLERAAPAAAAPAPEAPGLEASGPDLGDDAFDFFGDDLGELAPAEPVAALAPLPGGDAGTLSFGDDDLAGLDGAGPELDLADPLAAAPLAPPAAQRPAALDATVAILPEESAADAAEVPLVTPLEVEPLEGAEEGDFATLASELVEPERYGAEPPRDGAAAAVDPSAPLAEPPPARADAELIEPGAEDDSLLRVDSRDLAHASLIDPGGASGFDVSSSDLAEAAGSSGPVPGPPEFVPAPADASAALPPALRPEIRDALEKVAWESFGSVTEEIVRQVVDRVEAVAWEVVPRMAETLIRETIREMKGEPEEPDF